jgi:amino acid adenylation domain-containing protein
MAQPLNHNLINEFIKKSQTLNGQIIQEREAWNTEVTAQAIRHFAYGISDDNPLWLNADYASKTDYGKLVAPPTFLTSVLYPALHGYPMEIPMSSLIGSLEYEWFKPILWGDKLTPCAKQTGVEETRDRHNRRLVCILSEISYTNQQDELVGKANSNLVWIGRTEEDLLSDRQIYQYSEAELNNITQALEKESRRGEEILWGEDVEINSHLPPLVRGPLTIGDMICWQTAIGPSYRAGALGYKDGLKAPHTLAKNPVTGWQVKYSQQHEDFLMAKQRGMSAPFDNSVMRFAWLSPLLTNWMGDKGELKRLSVQMLTPVIYGDTVWYEGKVSKKTEVNGGILVEIRITGTNQLGELTTTGKSEVLLPSIKTQLNLAGNKSKQPVFIPLSQPEELCVHQLIEAQIQQHPQAIALIDNQRRLTYQQLNESANQLAHYLQQWELKPNTLIAIVLGRSSDYIISILAILKVGAGYLPLDPNYPQERLEFMLRDAQVSMVITDSEFKPKLAHLHINLVDLDQHQSAISKESKENLITKVTSNDLAYAVYTSGSTGQPKAVCIPHYSLSSYLQSLKQSLAIKNTDKYLHTGSFAFSAGVRQTWLPLFVGATLIIADEQQRQEPEKLFQLIKAENVSIWDTVPTIWRFNLDYLLKLTDGVKFDLFDHQLRLILVTGEPLSWDIPFRWRYQLQHEAHIINLYSQSETTGTVCYYSIPETFEQKTGIVPLGKPLKDTTIFLLDQDLKPVIRGQIGEIVVTGKRQVQGYLNRPQLTKEKFIVNPFDKVTHVYKTGDLARYSEEGILEFAGRSDRLVKIRGFRVELDEIETILDQHSSINETIVIARENAQGDRYLIAYLIVKETRIEIEELRKFLVNKLPDYMGPSGFIFLDKFPLTPNGKIDKKALPQLDFENNRENEYIAPSNETEIKLTQIWQEVLNIDNIGINDNFFSLGGHSLLATQVVSRIRNKLNIELLLRELFEYPTILQLAEIIEEKKLESNYIGIPIISREEELPLSFAQERLWFINQLEGSSSLYNISRVIKLKGNLNISAMEKAISHLVKRHESLRSNFINKEGKAYLKINPDNQGCLEIIDGKNKSASEREEIVNVKRSKILDLEKDKLIQFTLIQISATENILVILIHHIISDGWSMGILEQELSILYQGYSENKTPELPVLKIQYIDYSAWQRNLLQGEKLSEKIKYWQEELKTAPQLSSFATDYPRGKNQTFLGSNHSLLLEENSQDQLKQLSKEKGVSLFILMLTALIVLLYRHTLQSQSVIGFPVAGRNQLETENVIGLFVNTLLVSSKSSEKLSFNELLNQIQESVFKAYENQDLPFEKIVEEIQPERELNHNPLFQIWFNMVNLEKKRLELNKLKVGSSFSFQSQNKDNNQNINSKFDLTIYLRETKKGLLLNWVYNRDLYKEETIENLAKQYQEILEYIVIHPEVKITQIPLVSYKNRLSEHIENKIALPPSEKQIKSISKEETIIKRFNYIVENYGEKIAIKDKNKTYTYRQLGEKVNQISQSILSVISNKKREKIGILLDKSIESIASILATLKTGNIYIPLDVNYPHSRLEYIIKDSQTILLITNNNNLSLTEEFGLANLEIINLDEIKESSNKKNEINLSLINVNQEDIAYILYTSGSTGKPKGVIQTQGNVLHFIREYSDNLRVNQEDKICLLPSINFDAAVMDIYTALLNGVTLCLYDIEKEGIRNLAQWLADEKITIYHSTPTVYRYLLQEISVIAEGEKILPNLRLIVLGGEEVVKSDVEAYQEYFSDDCILINGYGSSESTFNLMYFVDKNIKIDTPKVSMGYPLKETEILLLDEEGNDNQVYGEIAIRSEYIAKGYYLQPQLTSKVFLADSKDSKKRIYRTGDYGRLKSDGSIEFLGRKDFQVKIRGIRIELGEIEATLNKHPQIEESVVIETDNSQREKYLVAYLVTVNDVEIEIKQLREYLQEELPRYMIPKNFVFLDKLPLTASGKVDRKSLPSIDDIENQSEEYSQPTTETEIALAQIWQEVLKVEKIGINDNFFSLGGHSLLATKIVSRIRTYFMVELPLRYIFEYPTIKQLCDLVEIRKAPRISQFTIMEIGEI